MAAENKAFSRLMERLRHTYRLVVMNNETFEEVGSYKLSLLNVYVLLCTIALFSALLVLSIVIFTPLKRYIPGYGDISEHEELIELYQKYDILEAQMNANDTYTKSIRKILVGDSIIAQEEIVDNFEMPESLLQIERIEEDEMLRKEVEWEEQLEKNKLPRMANGPTTNTGTSEEHYFFPPVSGQISASFKIEDNHLGVDVMAPKNTPIKAILDGHVISSDWTVEFGNTIGIQHQNNLLSFYKHNSSLLKKVGDYVKAGEAVALIGNTGTLSSGPHLHFELWIDGRPVNPEEYINFD